MSYNTGNDEAKYLKLDPDPPEEVTFNDEKVRLQRSVTSWVERLKVMIENANQRIEVYDEEGIPYIWMVNLVNGVSPVSCFCCLCWFFSPPESDQAGFYQLRSNHPLPKGIVSYDEWLKELSTRTIECTKGYYVGCRVFFEGFVTYNGLREVTGKIYYARVARS